MKSRSFPLETLTELITLRHIIYESKDIRLAAEIIQAMQLRGKVPLSVELTLLTMTALESPSLSNCALSIVRFINNLLDSQQDTVHAIPLSALCHQLNIPSFWVDIRHQITHQGMPSISVMQSIVAQMHQYLDNEFWALLSKSDNDRYLWSKEIICKFIKIDFISTQKHLYKLKCSDFYDYVQTNLPTLLLSEDWISDYLGYLLVELIVDTVVPIHLSIEQSFSRAMIYYCVFNNIVVPRKYEMILKKFKSDVIKIGLLAPYKESKILDQLLEYGCEERLIQQRRLYGNALQLPKSKRPLFEQTTMGSIVGDVNDQSWLKNGHIIQVDSIFNDQGIEAIDHKAFLDFKETVLAQCLK